MKDLFDYSKFTSRNKGYVTDKTQERIKNCRILIAGCGIGSSVAVCAARMGFSNFVFVDGDKIEQHNLNRQFYDFQDIGKYKVDALREQVLRINPTSEIKVHKVYLDENNVDKILEDVDIIFDTIDFLDPSAILQLHRCAREKECHLFTALSAGFGSIVWYFPPTGDVSLQNILMPCISEIESSTTQPSYAKVFESFIKKIAPYLDEEILQNIQTVLQYMEEGKPCPASQVSPGSFSVASIATTMIHDLLSGRNIPQAPKMIVHSCRNYETKVVDIP